MSQLLKRAKGLFGQSEPEVKPAPARKLVNRWHAVAIAPGPRACDAACELRDHRFLSREAPSLPLKQCDSPVCTCRYEHFDDRRKGPRRARELGVSIDGHGGTERREQIKRGRRQSDG